MQLTDQTVAALFAAAAVTLVLGTGLVIYSGIISSTLIGGLGMVVAAISLLILVESFYSLV